MKHNGSETHSRFRLKVRWAYFLWIK